jgi:acetolactate synthase-1/2/3 large subunit
MAHCGEKLIELLEAYGIDTVFGIPGVHSIELYRGLADSNIRHVTPRHEQGAGFMADGFARATGKPAACLIISGPGMTNMMTAMGEAYAESIPMLVISSVNRTADLALAEGRLHEMNHQREVTAGVTAFSHTLMRPDELPRLLARAFAIFKSARPRPVHIEIPLDVLKMPADHIDTRIGSYPNRPSPTQAVIDDAIGEMLAAKRPILFLGGGAVDARDEVRRLVSRFNVPTGVTVHGRGLLPIGFPNLVGI